MTADWALEQFDHPEDRPLAAVAAEVVRRFAPGAATPDELPRLRSFHDMLLQGETMAELEGELRMLSHLGYLRAALVTMAAVVERHSRSDVAFVLARELVDAIDLELGVRLFQALLSLRAIDELRNAPGSLFVLCNRALGEVALEHDHPQAALRHFEAALAINVRDPKAMRGWTEATRRLERMGITSEHRSRGLALLDGLDELELSAEFGVERYELGRPLGRGRHAVVYQAFDRRVGRDVAIKRLLDPGTATPSSGRNRILEARFFAEAKTLSRVRSPYVIALYDAQPRHRFIALELCRGGNLRLALRRRQIGHNDLDRIGNQLFQALLAVHCVGAVHRDIKPANILVRSPRRGASVALADFGLAQPGESPQARAGTLRYLAPELRNSSASASPESDRFAVGVLLLEIAHAPTPLPSHFDHLDAVDDPGRYIPEETSEVWRERLLRLLSPQPQDRQW